MARKPHPKKEIEDALRYAEANGWRVEIGGAHAWGRIYCPYNDEECRCGEFCIGQRLEHAEERREPCQGAQARGRQLHDPRGRDREGGGRGGMMP